MRGIRIRIRTRIRTRIRIRIKIKIKIKSLLSKNVGNGLGLNQRGSVESQFLVPRNHKNNSALQSTNKSAIQSHLLEGSSSKQTVLGSDSQIGILVDQSRVICVELLFLGLVVLHNLRGAWRNELGGSSLHHHSGKLGWRETASERHSIRLIHHVRLSVSGIRQNLPVGEKMCDSLLTSYPFDNILTTNNRLKDNNHIAIDLVRAELLSKLSLNFSSTLLAEFGVLLRAVLQVLLLLVSELSHELSGVTSPELDSEGNQQQTYLSGGDLLALLDDRSSADHRVGTDGATLLHDGSHANEGEILDSAGVQHGSVTDSDVVSDGASSLAIVVLLRGNNHSSILNVGVLTNRDGVRVSYDLTRNTSKILPRTTELYQTEEPEANFTSPITEALGATKAVEFTAGSLL